MENNEPEKTDSANSNVERRIASLEKEQERLRSKHIDRTFTLIQIVVSILGLFVVILGIGGFLQWRKFDQLLQEAKGKVGEIEEVVRKAKGVFAKVRKSSTYEISQENKEEVSLLAPDLLKREQEGEVLAPEMHFILGLDAYNKDKMEEAARHLGIAALSGNSPVAYDNWGNVLFELALMKEEEEKEVLLRESFDKYAKAVRLKSDFHKAYTNWGTALSLLAWMKDDEALFREAFDKFAEAVRIEPDGPDAYTNWGNALSALAGIKEEKEKKALFRQSFTKFAEALSNEPDFHEAYSNWAVALRDYAGIVKDGAERDALLKQAGEKEKKAEEINKRK